MKHEFNLLFWLGLMIFIIGVASSHWTPLQRFMFVVFGAGCCYYAVYDSDRNLP